jgi:hypothetical protein
MNSEVTDYPLLEIFLVSLVVILGSSEIGRRLGLRAAIKGGDNIATLEGAILGLLALMISFTFAMALSRFEARRDAVLAEANAIGTTALRARLLAEPEGTESLRLLRGYVQLRLDMIGRLPSATALNADTTRASELQEALWRQARAAAAKDNAMVPTGLYVQSLNEMIDDLEKQLTATRNRVPNIVLLTLYGIATVATAFTGYAGGLESRRSRLPVYVMGALVSAVILLIQDLDRPTSGFITVSQQPMIDAAASIAAHPE